MRSIDRLECRAFGLLPKEALRLGVTGATCAWTAKVDGRAEAMFGASPISTMNGRGRVWMLMTEDAMKHRKALIRLGHVYTQAIHEHFTQLENYVHADNAAAIRWLSRLGYAISGNIEVLRGQPMRSFLKCATPRH